MKRVIYLLILLLSAMTLSAQSIASLWKQYDNAMSADKPKTAISALQKIEKTAASKALYGDLLKALIEEHNAWGEVAEDSAKTCKARIIKWQKTAPSVVRTVLQTVMYYEQGSPRIDSLITSPDASAYTKNGGATSYKPLTQQGLDSRYFHNDLLSLIAIHTGQLKALQKYYASTTDRQAACVAGALWIESSGTVEQADSLIAIYQDLPECGAIALRKAQKMREYPYQMRGPKITWIDEALKRWPAWKESNELRNIRANITQAECRLSLYNGIISTDTDIEIDISAQNLKALKIRLKNEATNEERIIERTLPWKDEYSPIKTTISTGRLPLGRWCVSIADIDGQEMDGWDDDNVIVVSDLKVLSLQLPENRIRFVVVNAITGHPVPHAKLKIREGDITNKPMVFTTNAKGEYTYRRKNTSANVASAAYTAQDTAMLYSYERFYNNIYSQKPGKVKSHTEVLLDRAVYRPGQTVHVALVSYSEKDGEEHKVNAQKKISVTIRDAQYRDVKKMELVTDDFGTAHTDFLIPTDRRNGSWGVVADGTTESFFVEEYKRPKYEVKIERPTQSYKEGDTLLVRGIAKTYSGMPVVNARVIYDVKRRQYPGWWRNVTDALATLLSDTVFTAADGSFIMRMPMLMPKSLDRETTMFYNITANATVMDSNGESHSESLSLALSNRSAYLSSDMKEQVLADSAIIVTFNCLNASGHNIDAPVTVFMDSIPQKDAVTNKAYTLAHNIPSGKHTLMAICEGDTLKKDFVVYRKNDERPMIYTHHWSVSSGSDFDSKTGEAWMQVGSSDEDVYVLYSVVSGDKVLAQGDTIISNSNLNYTLSYKPEYGDGINISYTWVKKGQVVSATQYLYKPKPDMSLVMTWKTFRNKLVPGAKEEWSIRVTRNDGTPVKAQIAATLYDKSLDEIRALRWRFTPYVYSYIPFIHWNQTDIHRQYLSWEKDITELNVPFMEFSSFATDLMRLYARPRLFKGEMMLSKQAAGVSGVKATGMGLATARQSVESSNKVFDCIESSPAGNDSLKEFLKKIRTNLGESAFFMPAVETNDQGVATLRFTMPETVTTWQFRAFAHDKEMRYGFLNDEAMTQKQLMVQPNMPRFLREKDKANIAANIANLSDKPLNVKVTLTLLDAKTETTLHHIYNKVYVKAGQSASTLFPIDVKKLINGVNEDGDIIVRITAESGAYSDGEQHPLTIITVRPVVEDTTAIVVNPRQMLREALPKLQTPKSCNAVTLSNAFYANVMAAHLNDTIVSAANDNVLAQLLKLQRPDGGFAWYDGMESSKYMTVAVVKTIARANNICGIQPNIGYMLEKAFAYLLKKMAEDMNYQKKNKWQNLSATHLNWLYALTLTGAKGGTAETYFRKMLHEQTVKDDMHSKATAAVVMQHNGQKKNAAEYVEAIKEHTVYREDMGRYFDSYRAAYSWCDYRIPTHSMCVEAINDVTPDDTITISEMQRWLVQCKRTQQWDNAINAVNAIHAISLTKAEKPFLSTYTINPQDYKDCIKVKREIIAYDATSKETASKGYKVGDRVRVRLTITADRDYDFVTITDQRPACMEPLQQFSRYYWRYYEEKKDSETHYYFSHLAKGTHTVETDYYLDRPGTYISGTASAVCTYAPEFRGTSDAYEITISK